MKIHHIVIAILIVVIVANIQLPFFNTPLFYLFRTPITLYHLLVFGCLIWLAKYLSSPFREIIAIFIFLWLVSISGIFLFISGYANLLVLLIVIVLILSIV